jgi:hypothetical protein
MATVNNNWPTPVATDLVKDGWEAIKDLGDAIDTTLGVYAPPATGLTLINTTSFSAVSSQSFTNVFSSTYKFYRVLISLYGSASTNYRLRFGTSGSAYTGGEYFFSNYILTTGGSASTSNGTSQTSMYLGSHASSATSEDITNLEICNANVAANTMCLWNTYSRALDRQQNGGGFVNQNTQYTDFFLVPDSGTITGKAQIYGYNQ